MYQTDTAYDVILKNSSEALIMIANMSKEVINSDDIASIRPVIVMK